MPCCLARQVGAGRRKSKLTPGSFMTVGCDNNRIDKALEIDLWPINSELSKSLGTRQCKCLFIRAISTCQHRRLLSSCFSARHVYNGSEITCIISLFPSCSCGAHHVTCQSTVSFLRQWMKRNYVRDGAKLRGPKISLPP